MSESHDEQNPLDELPLEELDGIFEEDWPEDHRSGVVAVVGRPNVGKSTLINAILKQKVAIVSPKPQTTRKQQLGIYTQPDAQILFVDTPGLHKAQHKLGEYMVEMAERALHEVDIALWLIDVSEPPHIADKYIAETLSAVKIPIVVVLNKIDLTDENADFSDYLGLIEATKTVKISALNDVGVRDMLDMLIRMVPEGPRYYPAGQLTEVNVRTIAAETVREKIMLHTDKEIPHATAVEVTFYKEEENGKHTIHATIYVERDSQKGIIIGKKGAMIKRIGIEAREDIEKLVGANVYLDLHVKVLKNWRKDNKLMKRLGYQVPRDE